MSEVFEKYGSRLEITDTHLNVKVKFHGSVAIPLNSISAVRLEKWRSARLIRVETPAGAYGWALGDLAYTAARALAKAAGLPEPTW